MNEYITKADVDTLLGAGWEGTGDATQAVLEANIWLTAKGMPVNDPVDDAIQRAGAYLAREAANDRLYTDATGSVKRKRVKADSVESEKEYTSGDNRRSGALRLVYDLLRPWLGSGSTFEVRRA